jgi:hypothetical protein
MRGEERSDDAGAATTVRAKRRFQEALRLVANTTRRRLKAKMDEVKALRADVDAVKGKAKLYEDELALLKASRSASVAGPGSGVDVGVDAAAGKANLELKEKVARLEAANRALEGERDELAKEKDGFEASLATMRDVVSQESAAKVAEIMGELAKLQEEVSQER